MLFSFDIYNLLNCVVAYTDVPSSVRNLSVVEYGKDYVDLSWQCPEDDGGSGLVQYIVEMRDVTADAMWMACDKVSASELRKQQIHVGKLLKGNSYLFRVSAKNRVGKIGQPTVLREPAVLIGIPYYFCCINASFKSQWRRQNFSAVGAQPGHQGLD